jgi:KUP system potassium uptake protein
VPQAGRFTVEALELGFTRIVARYGYLEAVDVPKLLERVSVKIGRACYDPMETSFYLGRESLVPPERGNIFKRLLLHLFVRMHKNELDVTSHLGLPPNRVVELGARQDLVAR